MHQDKVKEKLKDYEFLHLNVDNHKKLSKSLKVKYLPLMIFYSSDGEEKARVVGGKKADELLTILDQHK